MSAISQSRHRVRRAECPSDIAAVQALRWRAFRGEAAGRGFDRDPHDARAVHVMIEEAATGELAGCLRLTRFRDGSEIGESYSAQFYDLGALAAYPEPLAEVGRFCLRPGLRDPDVVRLAWGAIAAYVDAHGIKLLFGCSSFRGTEAGAHLEAFALLKERHLAPRRWLPRVKAPAVFRFARRLRLRKPDIKRATRAMPPLLRSYLAMGGWVSDHAVVDRELGTLHVFTGLEIGRVPEKRARLIRERAALAV